MSRKQPVKLQIRTSVFFHVQNETIEKKQKGIYRRWHRGYHRAENNPRNNNNNNHSKNNSGASNNNNDGTQKQPQRQQPPLFSNYPAPFNFKSAGLVSRAYRDR